MSTLYRQRVVRADGRAINVVQRRAHLSYCFTGCCCGRTERGYAPVPVDTFKDEWLRRKLRNVVHLTKAGCLGPCALANVANLVFDGRAVWFQSVNTPWHVRLIFDYIETMICADRFLTPPSELTEYVFNFYDWDTRPKTPTPSMAQPSIADARTRIALLSHADTDLFALRRARPLVPDDLDVTGISLMRLKTEEQMSLLLDGDLAPARAIVMRLHGELEAVPGIARLLEWVREQHVALVVVSGAGEPRADFARVSTVGLDVIDAVRRYLTILLAQTHRRKDEVVVIACRGAAAHVLVEPTSMLDDVQRALDYVPTGGRTPLAHALELAATFVTDTTVAIILTDGHANVPTRSDDPWADALNAALALRCPSVLVDSESEGHATGRPRQLAEAMHASYIRLSDLDDLSILHVIRKAF